MIPVEPQPEPPHFDDQVRRPGLELLARGLPLSERSWKQHGYWRLVFPELHAAYRGVCAYSCHWVPRDSGAATVDHYRPKTMHPELAYEWSNYRLASLMLNARKREFEDVLDPFVVEPGWFTLDFPSLLVRPGAERADIPHDQVRITIDRLRLNDEAILETRWHYLDLYCRGDASLALLREMAPFLAAELERQGLVDAIRAIMNPAEPRP